MIKSSETIGETGCCTDIMHSILLSVVQTNPMLDENEHSHSQRNENEQRILRQQAARDVGLASSNYSGIRNTVNRSSRKSYLSLSVTGESEDEARMGNGKMTTS